uniref:DNA 3'-5' helicase n=1 Tax=Amphimedon queenslandica TaxID=400682 RepID=A0A1X7VGD1_AMPQE
MGLMELKDEQTHVLRKFAEGNDVFVCLLTATATDATRKEVIQTLGMSNTELVIGSPDKFNIYCVEQKTEEIEDVFSVIVKEMWRKRTRIEKTLIFCRKKPTQLERDIQRFCLFEMFTESNSSSLKSLILHSFASFTSRLHIVFATIAFGMGVDIPNIQQIRLWSPPSDVETYIQETGRAGRDGKTSFVKLFYSKMDLSLLSRVDNYLGRVSNPPIFCDTAA